MRFEPILLSLLTHSSLSSVYASPSSSSKGYINLQSSALRSPSENVTPSPIELTIDLVDSIWKARHVPGLSGPCHRSESDRQYYQRKQRLGILKLDSLGKERHIHNLPPELENTSTHERNTIRKRVLGLGFNDIMPKIYKGMRTSVYLEAEKMMKRDDEMDVHDAIKWAYAKEYVKMGLDVDTLTTMMPDLQASLPIMTHKGRRSAHRRSRNRDIVKVEDEKEKESKQ